MLNYTDEDFFSKLTAILTFFVCYIYSIAKYGLLLGGGIGWIPALIIAYVMYFFLQVLGRYILYAILIILGLSYVVGLFN